MFHHSVKVPRNFKIASNIVKKVSTEGGSVKTLLYQDKLRHFKTNVLYALITKTIQHSAELDKIFALCCLFENETRLDPWLAKVLATELLFGKKSLPGQSKPEQTINSYKEQFMKHCPNHQDVKTQVVRRPRYVRINTNLLTTSDAIRAFQDEGYRFLRCTSTSYNDYLKQIQGLTEYDFTQDFHVKYLFVFAPGTRLHEHELYLENKIVLQDKATAMAVHLLAPPPGSVALDMCAAPGMKTTQLAAFMRNQGKIYAVERNEERYQTLCDFVKNTGSKCVETFHKDALDLKRGEYNDVEYILLDPSCSGSGMELSVHNYIEDTRLAKLTSLQEKFLKHAMNAFPNAKRIVYSTCSLFPEENERVITNVVKTSRAKWRVQDVKELLKGQWNNFGSGMYGSMGARCMYAKPDSDYTIGFFLAVLDRDHKDLEKSQKAANGIVDAEAEKFHQGESVEIEGVNKKNKKKDKENQELEIYVESKASKKKKKSKKFESSFDVENVTECNNADELESATEPLIIAKKNKKQDKHVTNNTENALDEFEVTIEQNMRSENLKKKTKKKHKNSESLSYEEESRSEVTITENGDSENFKKIHKRKHKNNEAQVYKEESKPAQKKNKNLRNIEDTQNGESEMSEPKTKRKKKKERNNALES